MKNLGLRPDRAIGQKKLPGAGFVLIAAVTGKVLATYRKVKPAENKN